MYLFKILKHGASQLFHQNNKNKKTQVMTILGIKKMILSFYESQ